MGGIVSDGGALNLKVLKAAKITELAQIARDYNIDGATNMRKQEMIFSILQAQAARNGSILGEGVLEILPDGFGFLRAPDYNYLPGPDDIYISPSQIRKFNLRTGDIVSGLIRPPKEGERYFALLKVESINFEEPEKARDKILFDNLTPLYPQERIKLEHDHEDYTTRIIDLIAPIGKGQRGLIVARAVYRQDHDAAGDRQSDRAQPSGDRADRPAGRRASRGSHRHAALGAGRGRELDLRRARHAPRASGRDGDREGAPAGRAWHATSSSCSTRSPASRAPTTPSCRRRARFSPAASIPTRCTSPRSSSARRATPRTAASLTIIATALVDTGSRMDEVIFEEFKGTGNQQVGLDRRLLEKRIFPTIDIQRSSTRKEELLLPRSTLNRVWILRKLLSQLNAVEAMEFLLDKMQGHQDQRRIPRIDEWLEELAR